jgi:hypothetical protein
MLSTSPLSGIDERHRAAFFYVLHRGGVAELDIYFNHHKNYEPQRRTHDNQAAAA